MFNKVVLTWGIADSGELVDRNIFYDCVGVCTVTELYCKVGPQLQNCVCLLQRV